MSDREQYGLRGPVKSCVAETVISAWVDNEGKSYPEGNSEYTTEYDLDGRIVATGWGSSGGSGWVIHYTYDPSGRLLKTTSGNEGQQAAETVYSYSDDGKLLKITQTGAPDNPVVFQYDEHGRKTKAEVSRPSDYRPNFAVAGSPFESLDRAPNLPGGGTATTIYDEQDRAAEVQVRDAQGEVVSRAVRIYGAQGHIVEEKQILDNLETIFPAEVRAKILEESGASPEQTWKEVRAQLTKLMGGQSGPFSISYSYDAQGRITQTRRRIFNREEKIETTYNQHGDKASEITRGTPVDGEGDRNAPGAPPYSDVRYSYKYDDHGNWIEQSVSYRYSSDGAFQSSTVIKRRLTYY